MRREFHNHALASCPPARNATEQPRTPVFRRVAVPFWLRPDLGRQKRSSRLVSSSCLGVEYTANAIEPAVRRAGCRYGLHRILTKLSYRATPGWREFGPSTFNGIAATLPREPMLFQRGVNGGIDIGADGQPNLRRDTWR